MASKKLNKYFGYFNEGKLLTCWKYTPFEKGQKLKLLDYHHDAECLIPAPSWKLEFENTPLNFLTVTVDGIIVTIKSLWKK